MCEEEDKDYLMYISEITAYWAASFAAIIYIWETVYKSVITKRRKKKIEDPELGLIQEDRDSVFSSPETSPHSSGSLRSRIYSSNS